MIHVVFNEPDVKVLQEAIALDDSLYGEIRLIRDDYAVGPLETEGSSEGWRQRRDWWKEVLAATVNEDFEATLDIVDDKKELHQIMKMMEENHEEKLWIWAAQNKHDVSGYYWLISKLADFQGRVFILYLNNLPFFNEKGGIFYPQWLWQIPPKEFLKARKLARPVTPSEFEIDTDEWQRLAAAGKRVRLLEGGKKLVQFDEDYFDNALDNYVHGDFAKAARIIQNFLSKEKETTGDLFLLWRLKKLAAAKGYEVEGDMNKTPKDFELRNQAKPSFKKKAGEPLVEEVDENRE
jgi:hypothetical protein